MLRREQPMLISQRIKKAAIHSGIATACQMQQLQVFNDIFSSAVSNSQIFGVVAEYFAWDQLLAISLGRGAFTSVSPASHLKKKLPRERITAMTKNLQHLTIIEYKFLYLRSAFDFIISRSRNA